jgi:hypothetical protein
VTDQELIDALGSVDVEVHDDNPRYRADKQALKEAAQRIAELRHTLSTILAECETASVCGYIDRTFEMYIMLANATVTAGGEVVDQEPKDT